MANCNCCSPTPRTCNCDCNPCDCCSQYTPTTTFPVVDCAFIADCVKTEFQQVIAGEPATIDNACDLATKCVNDALFQIPLGNTAPLSNLGEAIFSYLRSLSGYTNSGTRVLKVINGTLQWAAESGGSGGTVTDEQLKIVSTGASISYLDEDIILVDTSGGNITITVDPTLLYGDTGTYELKIKKISSDANSVIIAAFSGTIDGTATKTFDTPFDSRTIVSNNTNLFTV